MSDTPRMDAIPRNGAFHHYRVEDVFAEGQKLERELAAVTKERDEARRKQSALNGVRNRMANAFNAQDATAFWDADQSANGYCEEWVPELAAALAERETLRQQLAEAKETIEGMRFWKGGTEDEIAELKSQLSESAAAHAECRKALRLTEAKAKTHPGWSYEDEARNAFALAVAPFYKLEKQVLELQADKERLDWLEKESKDYRSGIIHTRAPSTQPDWYWFTEKVSGAFLSLRSAIDAARKE